MSTPGTIALALGISTWESALVSRLTGGHRDRRIRRCVDVVELLADVGTGLADVVVIDAQFPRLDATAVGRIAAGARLVIGVSIDEAGEARLRQLGIRHRRDRSSIPVVAVEQVCALISSAASTADPPETGCDVAERWRLAGAGKPVNPGRSSRHRLGTGRGSR